MAGPYPWFYVTLPAIVVPLRAALLSTAGNVGYKLRKEGEYWQMSLFRSDGSIVFESGVLRTFPGYEIEVPFKRAGYKAVLNYYLFTPDGDITYRGHSNFPFSFKRKKKGPVTRWFLTVDALDAPGRQNARHTARIRAMRPPKPRNRREWTPDSSKGNKQAFQTIPTWNINNGAGTSSSVLRLCYDRVRGGTITPNYPLKKRQGKLPINAYSMTLMTLSDGGALTETWNTDGSGSTLSRATAHQDNWGSSGWGSAPSSFTWNSNVENRAIRKLQERVGPSANLAQDLMQINQLTNMIGDTAIRLGSSLRALRRGNLPEAAASLWRSKMPRYRSNFPPNPNRSLADNWLALQYGWKPLLQDIHGAMDAIARLNLASVVVYTARSSAQAEDRKELKLSLGVANSPVIGLQIDHGTRVIRYGIRYAIDNHLSTFLAQTGFANPINLAWEVLPYSFVVDWFIPIGPYLESLTAWNGLQFLDGYKVVLDKTTTIWSTGYTGKLNVNDVNDKQMVSYYGSARREWVSYARTKLTSFPSQSIPSFKSPLSVAHALNGLALLRTSHSYGVTGR